MRFDDRFPRQSAKLLKALRHLDAPDHGFVSAQFSIDGKDSSITRTLDDRKNAVRDTVTLNRTDLLTAITKCSVDAADMRVGNLVRLFELPIYLDRNTKASQRVFTISRCYLKTPF